MIKTLVRYGDSLALVIDRPILDLLKLEVDTQLEITIDGQRLIIAPASDPKPREESFRAALEKTNSRYGKALKKLAE